MFGSTPAGNPPSCLISIDVEKKDDTVPILYYAVPVYGVTNPNKFFIRRQLQAFSSGIYSIFSLHIY